MRRRSGTTAGSYPVGARSTRGVATKSHCPNAANPDDYAEWYERRDAGAEVLLCHADEKNRRAVMRVCRGRR